MQFGLLMCFLIVVQCGTLRWKQLHSKQKFVTDSKERKIDQGNPKSGIQRFNHTSKISSTKIPKAKYERKSRTDPSTFKLLRITEVVPSVQKTRLTKNRQTSNRKLSNRKNRF